MKHFLIALLALCSIVCSAQETKVTAPTVRYCLEIGDKVDVLTDATVAQGKRIDNLLDVTSSQAETINVLNEKLEKEHELLVVEQREHDVTKDELTVVKKELFWQRVKTVGGIVGTAIVGGVIIYLTNQ